MPDKHGRAVPGDTVYKPVTDHPDFERMQVHRGDGYYSSKREVAQGWADAWNAYAPNSKYPWHVKPFVLLPSRDAPPEDDNSQMALL